MFLLKDVGIEVPKSIETRLKSSMHPCTHMSSIAYRRPTVLGYPILCVPLVISIRSKWEYPKWSCSLYLHPIPSHPIPSCTPMYQGQNGNIPNCTTPHACIPTVHPIPMYPGKEGMKWEHPKLYHPSCLHSYCPSHPNVP